MLAFLLRCSGLSINIGSLYIGAMGVEFRTYLLGSVLGLIPAMLPYTVMGMSAAEPGSPIFIGAIVAEIGITVAAFLVYRTLRKKKKQEVS